MSFLLLLLCGVAGGVLGGMGLGGGTALIPLLTLVCGVSQTTAQGLNLLAFLPMAASALTVHARSGLLVPGALKTLVPAALALSVPASLLAAVLPSRLLGRAFGVFLIVLSVFWFRQAFSAQKSRQKFR